MYLAWHGLELHGAVNNKLQSESAAKVMHAMQTSRKTFWHENFTQCKLQAKRLGMKTSCCMHFVTCFL